MAHKSEKFLISKFSTLNVSTNLKTSLKKENSKTPSPLLPPIKKSQSSCSGKLLQLCSTDVMIYSKETHSVFFSWFKG